MSHGPKMPAILYFDNAMKFQTTTPQVGSRRTALNAAAGTLWYVPGSFKLVRALGPQYSLRCLLFHDVSDTESAFTKGLGGTITRKNFEVALRFLTKHYSPVSLQDVLASFDGRELPPRPVLVTFDDAYASVSEVAAPLCSKFGVPAVFFVNAACLDNRQLALDNLVCYVANVLGLDTINAAIHTVSGCEGFEVGTLAEVFAPFLPGISLSARKVFRDSLVQLARISERELSAEANLYLTSQQLRDLAAFDFEVGDHTYTHVNCRSLVTDEFAEEIDRNRAVLELASGKKVRSFSVPYGASADLTGNLLSHFQQSRYEAIFLAEGRANSVRTDRLRIDRVSIKAESDAGLFSEIEVLPRLRAIRNGLLASSGSSLSRRDSDLKKVTLTTWPVGGDTGRGAAVPRRTPRL
jgi:peptidoglycan/xylan/chitin deacetylase (PgdA/CDA1 family)